MNLDIESISLPDASTLHLEDKWILSAYNTLVQQVTVNLDRFEIGVALSKLYDFIWDIFCDWYIELAKPRMQNRGSADNLVLQNVLAYVLCGTLKLLHPFMPFITEEIYQKLPHKAKSIMIDAYPAYSEALCFAKDEANMQRLIDAIKAIRNRRAERNVPAGKRTHLYLVSEANEAFNESTAFFFEKLAYASSVSFTAPPAEETVVQIVSDGCTVYIPLADMVDLAAERARLAKEEKNLTGEIARLGAKLSNEGFLSKAPSAVVEGERAKLEKYKALLAATEDALAKLG